MPNVDMRGVVRSAFIVPSALAATSVLTLRGDRSRHDECCGLGSITSRFAAILARRASQHRECWAKRDRQLLQREGFQFDVHEWETPTKGKYNIDKIQRAAQNMAEVYVAARYLHNKAVTVLNVAPAVRMVPTPPPAPLAAAIVPEAVEVVDALAELGVRCYHNFSYSVTNQWHGWIGCPGVQKQNNDGKMNCVLQVED